MEERALKRQRSLADEPTELNRPTQLTPEQQLLLEKKRRQALERRLQRQATPSQARDAPCPLHVATAPLEAPTSPGGAKVGLSEEQLERIRQSREAALTRKRLAAGSAPRSEEVCGEAAPAGHQEEVPAAAPPSERATASDKLEQDPSCRVSEENPADGCQMQESCEGGDSDVEEPGSTSSASGDAWLQASEPSEGDGSSTSSSSSTCSSFDSSSDESEEEEEEEAELQEEVVPGGQQDDEEAEDREPKLDDEHQEEEAAGVMPPRCTGEARPKAEVPCCTERWPHVALQPITAGDVPASRTGRDRTAKQKLVAKLLCRWWYVLPDWPPKDFDYDAALAVRGYRRVAVEAFELEPDEDEEGLRKAFTVSGGFRGLYRDQQGCLVDVRPVEGRPSYDQLMLRATPELHRLVVLAYTRQLEELDSKPHLPVAELEIRQQLRQELAEAQQGAKFSGWFRK